MFIERDYPAATRRAGRGIVPSLIGAVLAVVVIGGLAGVMLLLRIASAFHSIGAAP